MGRTAHLRTIMDSPSRVGYVATGRRSVAWMHRAIAKFEGDAPTGEGWGDPVTVRAKLDWPCDHKCRGCDCDDESRAWRLGRAGDPVCTIVLSPQASSTIRAWLAAAPTEPAEVAYKAHDGDEGWCVVFAANGAEARRRAANEMDCEFYELEFCRRAPGLDRYAPGPVPLQALINDGWWFECHGCYGRVDEDTPRPIYVGAAVYCCPWCWLDNISQRLTTKAEERAVKARLAAFALERWPGVEVVRDHAYVQVRPGGSVSVEDANVEFRFPGGQCAVLYREADRDKDRNGLYPTLGDLPAWKAFVARVDRGEAAQ